MKNSIVNWGNNIFISSFDIFGKNDVRYEVKIILDGYQEVVDNGVHELYFNTKANDDSEIAKLLQYFENTDDSITDYGALSDAVRYYKDTEEGVSAVCDEVRKYGDERVIADRVKMVASIMKNTKCSLEEALKMLSISQEEYDGYISLLNMQQTSWSGKKNTTYTTVYSGISGMIPIIYD